MRVLAAALVLTALPSPAHAAPCAEGESYGAEKPPSLTDYIEQHLEVQPLSTEGKLETTRLTEAHENWSEDFQHHVAVCEAQEEAETAAPVPTTPSSSPVVTTSVNWDAIAACESGGNWQIDSTYDGGLQFSPSTWLSYGGGMYAPYAYLASREQQIAIAERVLAGQGIGAWPICGAYG